MFGNLGLSEIVIIGAIALVVMGPEKFPEFVKIALRAYRDVRGYVDDIKREMAEELHPIKKEIQQLARYNPEEYIETLAKAVADVDKEPAKKNDQDEKVKIPPAPAEASSTEPLAEENGQQDSAAELPTRTDD